MSPTFGHTQSFDLLLALLERHGRLVIRNNYSRRFGRTRSSKNRICQSNIALIRKALVTERYERYIETVPKRGYRFVAPVRELPREVNEPAPAATLPGNQVPVEVVKPRRRFHPLLLVILASALLVVGYFGTVRWFAARVSNIVPLATTTPFTTLPGREKAPTFAPDGNSIAFTWDGEHGGNTDIYVKQIGNESMLRLTTDPAVEHWPRWSPDGVISRSFGRRAVSIPSWARSARSQLDSLYGTDGLILSWTRMLMGA